MNFPPFDSFFYFLTIKTPSNTACYRELGMSLPDRRLVLFLLLGGVFGQQFGLDVGRNLDVLCELHLEGGRALVHILVHGDSPARRTKAGK